MAERLELVRRATQNQIEVAGAVGIGNGANKERLMFACNDCEALFVVLIIGYFLFRR